MCRSSEHRRLSVGQCNDQVLELRDSGGHVIRTGPDVTSRVRVPDKDILESVLIPVVLEQTVDRNRVDRVGVIGVW